MADGLSIAASVAGLVSLGFQVCSGITKYLDGIKSRAEELDSTRKYEQTLKTSIQALENILPQLVAHNQHSSTAVIACIQLCKDELEALRRLVAELCDETRNNPNLLDRAKASKKRLTYAFNRSRLTNLQARVDQASKSLQVTLQILGLKSSISQGQTLRTIESTSNDAVAEIIATKVEVTALADDVSHIRNEAPLLRAAIESIGPSLLDLGQTAIRSEQGIRIIREDATRANSLLTTQLYRIGDQLDAIQTQNAVNHRATTKLLQLTQLDKARLFNQMISKPSYLEEVSEECLNVGSPARDIWNVDDQPQMSVLTTTARDRQSSTSMLQFRSSRKCTCRPRHRLQRKQAVWSGFIFYQDNSWSENHFPTCDLWQQPKTTGQKWGMRQVGLGWLAHKAIELTFSCKFGAGGASFGPNFTYYPTVDEDAAPAFQTIQTLNKAVSDLKDRRQFNLSTWKSLFERALPKLETLFRKGQASPNDVNSRNQTLIYPITELVWDLLLEKWRSNDSVRFERLVLDFLENVTYLDIPSNIYDTNGESPMKTLTAAFAVDSAKSVEVLFGKAADIPSMIIFQENPLNRLTYLANEGLMRSVILQRKSQLIAEACGCGPLCQAVLIGDGKQVKRLLETDPRSIMEVNGWGQTPLHLSASQPDMLRLLLPALGPSQLNKPDFSGYTAFHYALVSSAQLCSVGLYSDSFCHGCHCTAPMKMLLKAGCAVDIGAFDYLYRDITTRCQRILVRGLKDRRDKLKRLALEKLPEYDIAALNLESVRTLDTQTAAVLGLLDLNGVQISPALRLTQTSKPATSNCYPVLSVYHTVENIMCADMLWDHGFQDIDEFNGQFDDVGGDGLPPLATCKDLGMMQWLVDRGANFSRELNHLEIGADCKALRVTTAHFVFRHIGRWLPHMDYHDDPDWYILSSLHEVLPVDLFDNCECSCSKQGCTPFLMMLKALIAQESAREGQSIISIIEPFLNYLDMSLIELTKDEWKEAIRYFTFTTLEMSHTCHHEPGEYRYTCSVTVEEWQDTMHVRDEQADMIELLEGILFDLDAMIDTMMDDENQFDMSTFLTDHWLERMEAELEAFSGHQLSEEYKKGTEALGVVWSEGETEEDIDSEPTGDVVQYWLNAIDKAAGF